MNWHRVFAAAIAVNPVTDWRYYRSRYSEKFMKTLKDNPKGYNESAVTNMEGFKQAKFLLVSGTGDDNVHFQNSATLVYNLVKAAVSTDNYRLQYYTDAAHNLNENHSSDELMKLVKDFLCDNFQVKCIN
jgi:dipeptidyl aminopeptidase/acylaminoacyl peptidase